MKQIGKILFVCVAMIILPVSVLAGCGKAPDVDKLKDAGNIKGLINVAGYENDEEGSQISIARREAAWQALVSIGAPAVDPLIEALDNQNVNIRRFAAGILGDIGDPRAADALVVSLNDPKVESTALKSLCKIAAPSSAKALLAYIDMDEVKNGALIEINVNYIQPVISGHGVDAASYQPGTQGVHPVVIADERPFSGSRANPAEDDPPNWNALTPESWRSLGAPESVQLVLCWDKIVDVELESIDYSSGITGERVREECTVTLREASTGNIVAHTVLYGLEPAALHTFEYEDHDFRRYGEVNPEILIAWLRPFVEG